MKEGGGRMMSRRDLTGLSFTAIRLVVVFFLSHVTLIVGVLVRLVSDRAQVPTRTR